MIKDLFLKFGTYIHQKINAINIESLDKILDIDIFWNNAGLIQSDLIYLTPTF